MVRDILIRSGSSLVTDGVRAGSRELLGGGLRLLQRRFAIRRTRDLAALAHNTSERARLATNAVLMRDFQRDQTPQLAVTELRECFKPLLDSLSLYFREYVTSTPAASCIKMLVDQQFVDALSVHDYVRESSASGRKEVTEPLVFTLVRDSASAKERGQSLYYVSDCTAFEHFCDRPHDHLYCPKADLKKLFERKEYKNPTPEFWKLYRSTMVIPIRWPPPLGHAGAYPTLVGFLCLDCKKAGRFPGYLDRHPNLHEMPESFNVAASVADDLFWPLHLFALRNLNRDSTSTYAALPQREKPW